MFGCNETPRINANDKDWQMAQARMTRDIALRISGAAIVSTLSFGILTGSIADYGALGVSALFGTAIGCGIGVYLILQCVKIHQYRNIQGKMELLEATNSLAAFSELFSTEALDLGLLERYGFIRHNDACQIKDFLQYKNLQSNSLKQDREDLNQRFANFKGGLNSKTAWKPSENFTRLDNELFYAIWRQ